MAQYPTLNKMGIHNPEDIVRYSVQPVDNIDILRIVYNRKPGSLLPTSKRFRFPRTETLAKRESIPGKSQIVSEVSSDLHNAMLELNKIVKSGKDREKKLDVIRDEVKRLDEDHRARIAYIQSLVDDL